MSIIVSAQDITVLFRSLVPEVTVTEVTINAEGIQLTAVVSPPIAICPQCGTTSTRVHSYYTRQPRDLPLSGQSVQLLIQLRRFRCLAATCPSATFHQRLPTLIAPSAQRTIRLNAALRDLALAFGGEAGARQSTRSAMAVSGDTLLRRAHTAVLPAQATPRILGIDDFAFRKGHVYGTILTDIETHAVIDLLPDRTAKTTAAWLKGHPGIEIVTRDRASDYARGVRSGAPKAVQVADRFHLVKNAGEVLERVMQRHHEALRRAAKAVDQERLARTLAADTPVQATLPEVQSVPEVFSRQPLHIRQRRLAQYQEVIRLAAQGLGPTAISTQVGLTRQTVARWLQAGSFPERAPLPPRPMSITPYESYLRERWLAGYQKSRQLWREVQAHGFLGGKETVRRLVVHWRTERGRSGPAAVPMSQCTLPPATTRSWSPRYARWLLVSPEAELTPDQLVYLQLLSKDCPNVVVAQHLIVTFIQLVRQRDEGGLIPWLHAAKTSGLPELIEFAKGIVRDLAAVTAALQYNWSNEYAAYCTSSPA